MFQPIRTYHVTVSTYSTSVPWSRDESRLSIHIMWSISQSRDVQSRKLKTIKYSVRDNSLVLGNRLDSVFGIWPHTRQNVGIWPEKGVMLQLGSRPVRTVYLPVMTMVQGVLCFISHGQWYQSATSITCAIAWLIPRIVVLGWVITRIMILGFVVL